MGKLRYVTSTKKYDPGERLTRNFVMEEFASCDGYIVWNELTELFMLMLQELRDWIRGAVPVSCIYRSPAFNKKIGGAANSMHLLGLAADIPWRGVKPGYLSAGAARRKEIEDNIVEFWKKTCVKYGIKGGSVELCDAHFHLDIREWQDGKFRVYRGESK